ncbi:MAG: 50S ribosomal protein L15 [Bacteroidetes bacterium]|nr:50S ribosomal protein L15 [Bacteroidota bacterium]MBK7390878.1 50S ribosomal protein L15 [Bacteroidota bacterium]MBK7969643.1 50S ribosomal protein L15 [Bacteroidota bacterium]MBK8416095.1 50S ribosomal protein L15 [Bacteroidota bacterium]MBK8874959.1 50S ribosomal protein L15 [Bacteroidota bacterium]
MNLSNLRPAKGSVKNRKRIGRGQGSGRGGTSTKGHKGAQSRSGYSQKIGFEGGQMPLQRRLPKFGFKSLNRVEYNSVNLDVIQGIVDKHNITDITMDVFVSNGLASKRDRVKILGRGEIKSKVNITAHAFSETAKAAIESLGGTTTATGK